MPKRRVSGLMPPHIYEPEYFRRIRDLEEDHWWAVGMRSIIQRLLDVEFGDRRNLRILDAGCGTGFMMIWLRRYANPGCIVGIDISLDALSFCMERGLVGILQASVTALPFSNDTFDLITCSDVLQHLPRDGADAATLKEYLRVLKRGGMLYLRTNIYPGSWRNGSVPEQPHMRDDFHHYTRREVLRLLDAAGYTIERATYVNMIPALVATWLGRLRLGPSYDYPPHEYRGLRMRMPHRWLNALLGVYMRLEAWYLARGPRKTLPYGHSLVCLARTPVG